MKKKEVVINVLLNLMPNFLYFFKRRLILSLLNNHGKNVRGMRFVTIVGYERIEIGNNFFASKGMDLSATKGIIIGDDITFGPNVMLIGGNHKTNVPGLKMNQLHSGDKHDFIIIENDVWVGANVIILSGVTVGEGTIIGAGSVVTKKMPPYSICAGNPCKPIKPRFALLSDLSSHLEIIKSKYSIEQIISQYAPFDNIWYDELLEI